MRFILVLIITIPVLLALSVACGGDEKEAPAMPAPASESDGEAEEWEDEGWEAEEAAEEGEDEGEPVPATLRDSDDDGFIDYDEERYGSDPLDPASVPETEEGNAGSCTDGLDNDGDGLIDGLEPSCLRDSDSDGFTDVDEAHHGSDPLAFASVPESEDGNPGSCTDGVDNDLDGDTDDADDGCPPAEPPAVSANLGVTPRDSVGPCPVRFTFAGFITLEAGSGPVSYEFVRSDGVVSDRDPLTFDSPGTQDVSYTWDIGAVPGGADSFSGWVVIRIIEPEEVESNRANFTLRCED